jgi:molecular chaperone GrpE
MDEEKDVFPEDQDVEFVASDEEGAALGSAQKMKELRDKIKELTKEKQEYLDGWQRARADYSNLVKAQDDDKKRLRGIIEEGMLEEFLPVVDSFSMAFNNKEAWEAVEPTWRTGVEYIYQQLMTTLENHGLHAFGTAGEAFDPNLHQAVSEVPTTDETQDHTVAKVLQQGFRLGDSVLRPARVSVYAKK